MIVKIVEDHFDYGTKKMIGIHLNDEHLKNFFRIFRLIRNFLIIEF